MSGRDASPDDMPIFPWSDPANRPPVSDGALDALLAGQPVPPADREGLQPVAELLAALSATAGASELTAEAHARAAFRTAVRVPHSATRRRLWRPTVLTSLLSAKLATAIAAGAVGLGGAAAAAYTGALPDPAQGLAHHTIGAPAAHPSKAQPNQAQPNQAQPNAHPSQSARPVGPDASGPAAFGLCTAYTNAKAHGSASEQAVAFRNLATAAGGASNVAAYCATVAHPGTSPAGPHEHATGKPTSLPTQVPSGHPTGKPTANPGASHRP